MIELYINPNDGKPPLTWVNKSINFRELRKVEKEISELIIDGKDLHSYVAIYDLRPVVREQAIFGMITTVVVIFLLIITSMFFSSMVHTLIISPIEQMIEMI